MTTYYWTGLGGNALWENAINWSTTSSTSSDNTTAMYPGTQSSDVVNFADLSDAYSVTLNSSIIIASFYVTGAVSITGSGSIVFSGTDTSISGGGNFTIAVPLTGTGGVTMSGTQIYFSGSNSYTGATTVASGTLYIETGDSISSESLITINSGAIVVLHSTTAISFTNSIVLNGTFTVDSTGLSTISGSFTNNGSSFGTLSITGTGGAVWIPNASDDAFTGTISVSGTSLTIGNETAISSIAAAITLVNATFIISTDSSSSTSTTCSGTITDTSTTSSTISKTGSGDLIFTGVASLTATNTITVNDGINVTMSGSGTIGNVSINDTLTFANTGTLNVDGVISGSCTVIKSITGITYFNAVNTYTGATTVSTGQLTVASGGSIAQTSAITIASGAYLQISVASSQTLSCPLTINGTCTIISTTTTATMTITGDIIGTSSGILSIYGSTATSVAVIWVPSSTDIAYSGTFTVNTGILQLGDDAGGAISSVCAITIASGATVEVASSSAVAIGGIITGAGAVTMSGSGSATLTGSNTYTGATTVSAGSLILGTGGAISSESAITVASGAAFEVASSSAVTIGSIIAGAGAMTMSGSGSATLTANNTYTGATTVSAGSLILGTGGAISSASAITVASGATFEIASSLTITIGNSIAGDGGVTMSGTGSTTLTGTNTYTGTTTVSAGTLILGTGGSISSTSPIMINSGGIFELSTSTDTSFTNSVSVALNGTFTVASAGLTTISGSLTGDGSSAGTLSITGTGGAVWLPTASDVTFSGTISVSSSSLTIGNDTAISSIAAAITLVDAKLIISTDASSSTGTACSGTITNTDTSTTSSTISKTGSGDLILSGVAGLTAYNTITVDAGINVTMTCSGTIGNVSINDTLTFATASTLRVAGVISGSCTVIQSGTGTTYFSGVNTYTGATTVSSGTLTVNGSISQTSAITIASDANCTFNVGSSNTLNCPLTINGTCTITQSTATATMIITGAVTGTSSSTLTIIGYDATSVAVIWVPSSTDIDYSGTVQVTTGILQIGNGTAAIGTIPASVILSASTTLVISTDATSTTSTVFNGTSITGDATSTLQKTGSGDTQISPSSYSSIGNIAMIDTLYFTTTNPLSVDGVISGSCTVVQSGSGSTTLNGVNTYTGATTVSSGALSVASGGSITQTSAITIASDATCQFNVASAQTVSCPLTVDGTCAIVSTTATATMTIASDIVGTSSGKIIISGYDSASVAMIWVPSSTDIAFSGQLRVITGILQIGDGAAAIGTIAASVTLGTSTGLVISTDASSDTPTVFNGTTITGDASSTLQKTGSGATQIASSGTIGNIVVVDTLYFATTSTLSVGGVISGSCTVVQSGSGSATLNGVNTYSGATTVSSGSLSIHGSITQTSAITIASGATCQFTVDSAQTLSCPLTVDGNCTITSTTATATTTIIGDIAGTSSGTLSITGYDASSVAMIWIPSSTDIAYSGALTINTGILHIGNGTAAVGTIAASVTLSASTTLVISADATSATPTVFNGTSIAGNATSTLQKTGSGTTQIVSSGTIGNIAVVDTLYFTTTNPLNVYGVISGSCNVVQSGSGSATLIGVNTYTGATTVSSGTLTVNGSIAQTTEITIASDATCAFNVGSDQIVSCPVTVNGTCNISSVPGTTATLTIASDITGTSSGILNIFGNDATYVAVIWIPSSTDIDFSGQLIVNSGILQIGNGTTAIGTIAASIAQGASAVLVISADATSNTPTVFNGTIFYGTSFYADVTSILQKTGSGATHIMSSSDTNGNIIGNVDVIDTLHFITTSTLNVAGVISGSCSVVQSGSGTVTLNGANTYTGATTISSGSWVISDGGSMVSDVVVDSGATLSMASTSTTTALPGTITIQSGGTATITSATTGTTTLAGDIYIDEGASFVVNSSGSSILSGEVTLSQTGIFNITGSGVTTISGSIVGFITSSGIDLGVVNITGTGGIAVVPITTTVTYSGTLAVSGTSVTYGDGTTEIDSIATAFVLTDGASLTVNTASDTHLVGTLTNTDATATIIHKSGSGDLYISGADTALTTTNTISIDAGCNLVVTGSGSFGNITAANSVLFDSTDACTINGTVSGACSVDNQGSGTLTLTGTSTFTGTLTATYGTVVVNGSVVADVGVQSGAVLKGSGTVGNLTVSSSGTLSPGNSPGLLTVSGDMVLASGSITEWELDGNTTSDRGTSYDGMNVSGAVTITDGATLRIVLLSINTVSDIVTSSFWLGATNTWPFIRSTGTITGTADLELYFNTTRQSSVRVVDSGNSSLGKSLFSAATTTDSDAVNWLNINWSSINTFMVFVNDVSVDTTSTVPTVNYTYTVVSSASVPSLISGSVVSPDADISAIGEAGVDTLLSNVVTLATDGDYYTDITDHLIAGTEMALTSDSTSTTTDVQGTVVDTDGLWRINVTNPDADYTTLSGYTVKMYVLGANAGDHNMLCCYYVPPGTSAPASVSDISRLYVLIPDTSNVNFELGYTVNLPTGIPYTTTSTVDMGTYTLTYAVPDATAISGGTTALDVYTSTVPTTTASTYGRYGFVVINKGWSLIQSLSGSSNSIVTPSWSDMIEHCRFSQYALNAYTGYNPSLTINASHYAALAGSTTGTTAHNVDVFAVEDLPHTDGEHPGWDVSDNDFNDIVFALEYTKIQT